MRRRQVLAGLVGVTGCAVLGAAAPLHPQATAWASHLERAIQPTTEQALRARMAGAHDLFAACRYDELAATLPEVIATAQAGLDEVSGVRRDRTFALLADAYSLASDLCSRLHDDALGWVTADRARVAAAASGDPTSIAEAARMSSIAMRRHGHHDAAITLLTRTALDLGADAGDPPPAALSSYGSLLCTAAYTAAQNDRRQQALDLIGEAESAATRLTARRSVGTPFSSTNVAIYQIGVHTALGDAGTALDYARRIDVRRVPTPERQARFGLDTARAWHRFGNPTRCLHALQAAERWAPEELRRSSVQSLVVSLLDEPGPTPAGLRDFAVRIGAIS